MDAFRRRIRNELWRIINVPQLKVVLQEQCDNISQRKIADLILSNSITDNVLQRCGQRKRCAYHSLGVCFITGDVLIHCT